MLDLLRNEAKQTGALASEFPELSRFAVMQHLGVLEEAGLVLIRREGRHRLNFLNAIPLQQIHERWVSALAAHAATQGLALKEYLEPDAGQRPSPPTKGAGTMDRRAQRVQIESELRIEAAIERVFAAMTVEQLHWYPYNYGGERVQAIVFEQRVGGHVYEDWGDGNGHHYGIVTSYDAPRSFTMRGFLGGGTVLENRFVLRDDDGATVLQQTMTAFGDLTDDDVVGIRTHGDMKAFEPHLRAWCERGEEVAR